jgi:cation:H+ antiporter
VLVAVGLFVAATLVILVAGVRVPGYASVIADRTGLGRVFAGALLLAGATSLPELVVTTNAAYIGSPDLALGNIFGSITFNILIIAVMDLVEGFRPMLIRVGARQLFAGISVILLCAISIFLLSVRQTISFLGVGLDSVAIAVSYAGLMWLGQKYSAREVWLPEESGPGVSTWRGREPGRPGESDEALAEAGGADGAPAREGEDDGEAPEGSDDLSLRGAVARYAIAAGVIVVAGVVLSNSADAIVQLTGLGATFVGSIFLAIATSIPELVVAISAARQRQFAMAVGGIFGSSLNVLAFVLIADVAYRGGPITEVVTAGHTTTALLAIVLASVALAGLIYRSTHAALRLGFESIAIVAIYLGGVFLLYVQSG